MQFLVIDLNVLRIFIYAHKKAALFPAPIFTKLSSK